MATSLTRRALLTAAALGLATVAACSTGRPAGSPAASGSAGGSAMLTIYTDQHAELIKGLTEAYTNKTGVQFRIQNDATVGQIESEGKAAPADLFLSEDPSAIAQLGAKALLAPVAKATLDQVVPGLSSGKGLWVAYAARARVLYYNPKLISEAQLPKTLEDLAKPQFKGTFAYAPSGTFVAMTQYLLQTWGTERTKTFLLALKDGGVNEQKDGNVRDTVEAGKHAIGLANHYYWWVKATEVGGPDKMTSKIYHFPTQDPGNLILSSGAGVLKTSKNQDTAAAFLTWLTAKDGGQGLIAGAGADISEGQYPVAPGLGSTISGSLADVKSPPFDMDKTADGGQAERLIKELGLSN